VKGDRQIILGSKKAHSLQLIAEGRRRLFWPLFCSKSLDRIGKIIISPPARPAADFARGTEKSRAALEISTGPKARPCDSRSTRISTKKSKNASRREC